MSEIVKNNRQEYRKAVNTLGKKEFTLLKMQEYGFWPENLPTPYERQATETKEQYEKRQELYKKYENIINEITEIYKEKDEINNKLNELRKKYDETWDYEKIRQDVSNIIMQESIERRKARKKEREEEKRLRSEEYAKKKAEKILFIGKGYSDLLHHTDTNEEKLQKKNLPIIRDDKELGEFLGLEYKKLRFLVYHRDVFTVDHYHRYSIPKKKGGMRSIAAPKPLLKNAQRKILDDILCKIEICSNAHGFIKGKSVVTSADNHVKSPDLLINIDLEDFFNTITFERVRGMFKGFGYSGYVSSMLAMICTYCEVMEIEIKGEKKFVKTSDRILPQGSPASPMITNILCRRLDKRINGLASKYEFAYTRYADDMSFSLKEENNKLEVGHFFGCLMKIVKEEGFNINPKKTKFLRKNNRQCITGIVINNDMIGVPKKWIKTLRAIIYNANKLKEQGQQVPQNTVNEIKGMISWLKSVNEERYKAIIKEGEHVINN